MKSFSVICFVAVLAAADPTAGAVPELLSETIAADAGSAIARRALPLPLVASVGSSYSYGVGLDKSYGRILAEYLAIANNQPISDSIYRNHAVPGSKLYDPSSSKADVTKQALNLAKDPFTAVVLTSGGKDLNYYTCLAAAACDQTKPRDEFIRDFKRALDAIRDNTQASTVIYVVTYPQGIGSHTICSDTSEMCKVTNQLTQAKQIYQNLISWTVTAFDEWNNANSARKARMIRMLKYSDNKHDVGSVNPWLNGSPKVSTPNGQDWHPNQLGAEFMARAIFNDQMGINETLTNLTAFVTA